jgi:tripartite-type tricarboxylate transporter receptor subunit TctC
MHAHATRWFVVLALMICGHSLAQPFPARPITIIVPFAGGGPTDTLARLVAAAMAQDLKTQVTVENVGGGGGTVGAARVAKAANDGYTLLLDHIGHVAAPALYSKLPYDAVGDFAPIGRVADVPMTLVGRATLPPQDAKDLLSYMRANGKRLNYAHAGIGAASHLCGLLLMKAIGTQLTLVAYKGTGPAMTDLVSGQIDLMCDQTTNTFGHIRSGRIKVYAVTTPARLAGMKDVPTLGETGLKGFDLSVWHALYAPRGTPKSVVDRLASALQVALRNPDVAQRLAELGAQPVKPADATPAALQAWLKSETGRWGPIIKAAGAHAE